MAKQNQNNSHSQAARRAKAAQRVPSGGSSTIYGIRYQMLWSLLRTTELHIRDCQKDERNEIIQVILRLEPIGGGGDLQEIGATGTIVEQVKARSDGGAWSLREVIDEVLPDLYRANPPANSYRFITEGKRGGWERTYEFFQSLGGRNQTGSDILEALDDESELSFDKLPSRGADKSDKQAYWKEGRYSERSLFEHIVSVIRKNPSAKEESLQETQHKLRHLLSHFEMLPLESRENIQSAIDDALLVMGCPNTELEKNRRAMTDELMELATAGNADIDVAEFLREYGLSVSINKWLILKNECASVLHQHLRARKYDVSRDARVDYARSIANACISQAGIMVLSGGAGQETTWALYGAAHILSEQRLVIVLNATEDAEQDLESAARLFCREIWGLGTTLPMSEISARLRKDKRTAAPHWLTLCLNGLQNLGAAQYLAGINWENWGISLLVSCDELVAQQFDENTTSPLQHIKVNDFSHKELSIYFRNDISGNLSTIPEDIRQILRRTNFANVYRDIHEGSVWDATYEYKICARCWQLISEQNVGAFSLDTVRLRRIACSVAFGKPYPWLGEQLLDADFDDRAITRLTRAGWLQSTLEGCYEITNSRLMNWAVAEGLVASYRASEIDDTNLCDTIQKLYHSEGLEANRNLDYVPMDALWLLTALIPTPNVLIDRIILTLEKGDWRLQSDLYKNLLPTLGTRIASALVRRLETLTPDEAVLAFDIYDALAQFPGEIVAPEALRLLKHPLPAARLRGCCVFNHCPSAAALDALWNVRCDIHQNPALYVEEQEQGSMAHRAEREALDALRACIPLCPEWLPAVVEAADPLTMPVSELPHLVAAIEGHPEIWGSMGKFVGSPCDMS